MERFIIISGCSGGGKSTLLAELQRLGYAVVEEPGRRIVAAERAAGREDSLPWVDAVAFAQRAIDVALADWEAAQQTEGWVFFDRALIDAAAALEYATGQPELKRRCRNNRYASVVFIAPPWPEIFVADDARRHDMADAIAEYERLLAAYSRLGYQIDILPKIGVAPRADYILERL